MSCELDTIVIMKTNSGILFIIIFLLLLLLLLGFRYELYCVAKAHKTTHCVVSVEPSLVLIMVTIILFFSILT